MAKEETFSCLVEFLKYDFTLFRVKNDLSPYALLIGIDTDCAAISQHEALPMQVTLQALFPDDGHPIIAQTNAQATAQTLISSFCSQKGIPYSSKYGVFDAAKRPVPVFSTIQAAGITEGQTLYIGYRNSSYNWKARWQLYAAGICLIAAIIGILAMTLTYSLHGGVIPFDYGVVMDAGSSKTNTLLYHWLGNKYRGTGRVQQIDTCTVKGGIAKYEPSEGIAKVVDCAKKITTPLEEKKIPETPLYFASTAGMRLLRLTDPNKVEFLIEQLETHLNESGLSVRNVSIITGRDEGIYAWITTNFLEDTLEIENTEPWTPITYGALDMGGASTQVAFELPPTPDNKNNVHVGSMKLYGERHDVFAKSYLCFGRDEAQRRFQALLMTDPKVQTISDPCSPEGSSLNITGEFLFGQPCTKAEKFDGWIKKDQSILEETYTLVGTSDYETCRKNVKSLMDTAACKREGFTECFDNLPRPLEDQKFLAFATYFYTTEYLGLTESTLEEYEAKTKEHCLKHRSQIPDNSSYAAQYCFNAVFIHEVLVHGYGFNATTWKNLDFIGTVDGKDIGWSLGYMIYATNAIPAKKPSPKLINAEVLIVCLLIFIVALMAAIIYITHTLCRKKEVHANGSAQSLYESP